MEEIREDFHELANKLNNISISAGTIVEMARLKNFDSMSKEEIKEELKKTLDALSSAVDSALKAGEIIPGLKKKIY